ncbi:MAG: hypothetical protein ACQESR_16850 [Planctomycetota bacterium]
MERRPTQAVLPLVGLVAEKVIRDQYISPRHLDQPDDPGDRENGHGGCVAREWRPRGSTCIEYVPRARVFHLERVPPGVLRPEHALADAPRRPSYIRSRAAIQFRVTRWDILPAQNMLLPHWL